MKTHNHIQCAIPSIFKIPMDYKAIFITLSSLLTIWMQKVYCQRSLKYTIWALTCQASSDGPQSSQTMPTLN